MEPSHIILSLLLAVSVIGADFVSGQDELSSNYILSRVRRSPQVQRAQASASAGGGGYGNGNNNPYFQAHLSHNGGFQRPVPGRFDFHFQQQGNPYQQNQGRPFRPVGNGYYDGTHPLNWITAPETVSTPPPPQQNDPGVLIWVPLATLQYHVDLQRFLQQQKVHNGHLPGMSFSRRHTSGGQYPPTSFQRPPPPLHPHLAHMWTKDGEVVLPHFPREFSDNRRISSVPSEFYRPPTVLREMRRRQLPVIRTPAEKLIASPPTIMQAREKDSLDVEYFDKDNMLLF